jgi:hypothetical protein
VITGGAGCSFEWGIGPAWMRPQSGSQTVTGAPDMFIGAGALVAIIIIIILLVLIF